MKFNEVTIGMLVCMTDIAFADDFSSGYGIVTRIYDDKIKVVSVNPIVEAWTSPTHHVISVDDLHHVDFSPEHVSGCYALDELTAYDPALITPFMPINKLKPGQRYYAVTINGAMMERHYNPAALEDALNVKLGNAYHTRGAAAKNAGTIMEKLKTLTALANSLKSRDDNDDD